MSIRSAPILPLAVACAFPLSAYADDVPGIWHCREGEFAYRLDLTGTDDSFAGSADFTTFSQVVNAGKVDRRTVMFTRDPGNQAIVHVGNFEASRMSGTAYNSSSGVIANWRCWR